MNKIFLYLKTILWANLNRRLQNQPTIQLLGLRQSSSIIPKASVGICSFFISILVIGYLVYIFTRSIFSSIVIFILGIALCYISTRKPKDINYGLDDEGIVINNTDYPFSVFKSYTLISEGGLEQIALISVKRFSPDKTIYFEPQDKDKIISLLGEFLPLETNTNDAIDKFMKKLDYSYSPKSI